MIPTEVRRGHVTFPRPSENKQPRPLSSAALPYSLIRQKAKAPSSPGSLQFRDLHRAGETKPGLGGSRAAVKRRIRKPDSACSTSGSTKPSLQGLPLCLHSLL